MNTESITLYFRAGSSDKVYHAAVDERPGGYVVNFAYGRRGSTLQTGAKTHGPVSFDEAKKIYDKLVREKTQKGYTPGANGTPYSGTDNAQRSTGILPQLLNPVDEGHVEKLLADSTNWMQQKMDGKRVIIQVGDKITGINRKGLTIGLPESIVKSAAELCLPATLDGEAIGDTFYAFDLIEFDRTNLRPSQYRARHEMLACLLKLKKGSIQLVPTYSTPEAKRDAFDRLKQANAEGVVFKNPNALYTPGRPASGGPQLKFKFYATASMIVSKVNVGKRSIAIELYDGKRRVNVGNVTIPPNAAVPAAGSIADIRYLHAFRNGSIYQPLFLHLRDDVDANDCTTAQLKYRSDDDVDSVA